MTFLRTISTQLCTALLPFVLLLTPLIAVAQPPQSTAGLTLNQIKAEHQQVLNDLNGNGHPLDFENPQTAKILSHGWALMGAWAAAYFDAHPKSSSQDLQNIFDGFAPKPHGVKSQYGDFLEYPDYNFAGDAFRIGPDIYVAGGSYWKDTTTSGFAVVAHGTDGHFHALWNIKDVAEKHFAAKDEIGRWFFLVGRAYYNGPLAINKILPLPATAAGHARFLVDAYQSADGGTALAQLSMWEWDGTEAKPLLIKPYQYARDFTSFRFDGNILRISTKEELRLLFSCGSCPEPRGLWEIRVTQGGVLDLGHRCVDPEIRWADELLARIADGEDTRDRADPKIAAEVKAYMKKSLGNDAALDPSLGKDFSWGLLSGYRILIRHAEAGAFEVNLDEAQLRLRYVKHNGEPYFTDIQIQGCCSEAK